jgi:cytochrome c peroxidase
MDNSVSLAGISRRRAKQAVGGALTVSVVLLAAALVGLPPARRPARLHDASAARAAAISGGDRAHGRESETEVKNEGNAGAGQPSRLASLGRRIFVDAALSEPAGTSCASCHDPARGYAGDNGSARGVPAGSRPGRYARRTSNVGAIVTFV